MKKTKFALFFDSLFLSVSTSFIFYIWLNKIYKNAIFVNLFSIIALVLSFILFLHLFFKHNNKLIFKNDNEKFLNNCINNLILSPNVKYSNFICELLNCSHIDNFLFKLNDKILYINIKTELTASDYFLAQESLIKNLISTNKLYFIYKSKNKSFDDIISISDYQTELFSCEILMKIMSQKNLYPIQKETIKNIPFKTKLKNNIKTKCESVTSKHFKEFFFSGISLLFLSLVVPFSNYYLITGTFLLIVSIISLFRKNTNTSSIDSNFLIENNQK